MSKRQAQAFHPPLFALHPPLSLYAANVSLIPFSDALAPMLMASGVACLAWLLLGRIIKDYARAASAVSVVAYGFFLFGDWELWLARWDFLRELVDPKLFHKILLAFVLLAISWLLSRKWRFAPTITAFLNISGAAMVLFAGIGILQTHLAIKAQLANSVPSNHAGTTRAVEGRLPDVFYIILDGYGRQDVLERYYGFDNGPFIEELRKRGFFIAGRARPNYVQTELSLASSLNLDYVQNLVKPMDTPIQNRAVLDGLIDRNRVASTLRELGYRYFAVTTGFPALVFKSPDVSFNQDFGRSLFLAALMEKTPFAPTVRGYESMFSVRYKALLSGFKNIQAMSKPTPGPRFVFAHIMAPHPPFVLDADGGFIQPKRMFGYWDGSHYLAQIGTVQSYREGYVRQIQAVNKLLLRTIDALLADAQRPPLIILQGDHGPKLNLDQESLDKTDLGEVCGILAAYLAPESMLSKLPEGTTPINAMRTIVSGLTGRDLGPVPDRTYYSAWSKPMAFVDVTGKLEALEKESAAHNQGIGPK